MRFKEYFELKEMAKSNFGQYKGKHINDIDSGYANWLLKSIKASGEVLGTFSADDRSGRLSKDQVIQALELRARNKSVAPTSIHEPVRAAGGGFNSKQEYEGRAKSKDPVASKIIERLKESNNLLSRLASYFGSKDPKYQPIIEREINQNLNVIVNEDTSLLVSRLKKLYEFLWRFQPKLDYKLRIAWSDEHEHIRMLLYDVLGEDFDG